MQIGMIGLGCMGANMAQLLMNDGHECVVFDLNVEAVANLSAQGAVGVDSLEDFIAQLSKPRAIWLMLPAALVDQELAALASLLEAGDIVIDGGNSFYRDDIRRGAELKQKGIHYVDVGTSGRIAGLERGYCLMIGGEQKIVRYLYPIFASLAPGVDVAAPTPGRKNCNSTAEQGFLYFGLHGAGHFVKMVHNGIEYSIMEAYAETTSLRNPEYYQYELDLREIAEVRRRGSVIRSWLLDLTATALLEDPDLKNFAGRVSDSGEARWTIAAVVDEEVPVISAALFGRFESRGDADYADRPLSALRKQFGGHIEKKG